MRDEAFFLGREISRKQTSVCMAVGQPTKGDRHVEHHQRPDFLLRHFADLASFWHQSRAAKGRFWDLIMN